MKNEAYRNIVCSDQPCYPMKEDFQHQYNRSLAFGLGIAILFLTSCATVGKYKVWAPKEDLLYQMDGLCRQQMEGGHFPGMAVAIAKRGKIWSKGYGFADISTMTPVDPEVHLFRIGSVSKTVTAVTMAREKEKGILDLDTPIVQYYHEVPQDKASLTLRQIAGHMAGIRHYQGNEFFSQVHYTNVFDPLEVFIHDTLLFVPGTRFSYSTYGWNLISAVMEKAAGKPFTEMVREDVCLPLHLSALKPDQVDSTAYPRVTFYDPDTTMQRVAPFVDNSNKWAGGGFLCSAADLARFGAGLEQPGFLKQKTLKEFMHSQSTSDGKPTGCGIGFFSGEKFGETWYGHSGGSVGGTSMLLLFPKQKLVVITLVNLSGAKMDDLAGKLAQVVLGQKEKASH